MKQVFLNKSLLAAALLLTVPTAIFAQQEKLKDKEKKSTQQIIITQMNENPGKMVIEIDGDKVKVNGKDASDNKDVSVHVNKVKAGTTFYRTTPGAFGGFSMNNDDHAALFTEDAKRPMLGVTTEGNDKGAEVKSVNKESGAEKAGLKKGDVITNIGGKKIESSDDVSETVRALKPGDNVEITYLRDGKQQKAKAEIGSWKGIQMNAVTVPTIRSLNKLKDYAEVTVPPMEPFTWNGGNMVFGGRPKLGLSIQDTDDGKGVKVLDVDDDSNAAKAGIKENDIITHVDDTEIKSTEDMSMTIKAKSQQSTYRLQVIRDGKTQNIVVKTPKVLKKVDL
jgi:serine protease Do